MWFLPTPRPSNGEDSRWRDGSRFRAYVSGDPIELESALFGKLRLSPEELRSIVPAVFGPKPVDDEEEKEVLRPHVVLAGGDLIVGQIDLDALHFVGSGEVLPIPPSQIRLLHNPLDGEEPEQGTPMRFQAEIWGGGSITSELRELVVPVRTSDGVFDVPTREIVWVRMVRITPLRIASAFSAALARLFSLCRVNSKTT